MIEPTVGRVVWFYENRHQKTPAAALICYVHGPGMVNVAWFDHNGFARQATSVKLLQGDEERPEYGYFCEWMPFQKGQATRTEAAEKALAATS